MMNLGKLQFVVIVYPDWQQHSPKALLGRFGAWVARHCLTDVSHHVATLSLVADAAPAKKKAGL